MPRLTLRANFDVDAITVSPHCRDVVLAGRSGLYVVDLCDPYAVPRWLPLNSVWEVSSIRWCPHTARVSQLVSTSNQKALVWNLALSSDQAVEHVLHGHRRAVSDVDFSAFHPDILATASIDTTVKLWDLRQPQSDIMSFSDFAAGATKIKLCPVNDAQLSSVHGKRVVNWDKRWANRPVCNWEAHSGECNGVEYLANGKLLTCSSDRTIRIWESMVFSGFSDHSMPSLKPELTIKANFPVLRAIPTPYELGAIVIPLSGGNNCISLINLSGQSGDKIIEDLNLGNLIHQAPAKSAMFMRNDQSAGHYNVLTWCQDSKLREFDGSLLNNLPHASSAAGCKDDKQPPLPKDTSSFNTLVYDVGALKTHHNSFKISIFNQRSRPQRCPIDHMDWIDGILLDHQDRRCEQPSIPHQMRKLGSDKLSQEIISVSPRFPNVVFKDINVAAGSCEVNLQGPWGVTDEILHVQVTIRISENYPYEPMHCQVIDESIKDPDSETTISNVIRSGNSSISRPISEINKTLADSCNKLSRHGIHALEFCIRYLLGDPVSIEDTLLHSHDAEYEHVNLDYTEDFNSLSKSDELINSNLGDDFEQLESEMSANSITDDSEDDDSMEIEAREPIIDSTPLPKNCGAVWSPTGKLICFFNHRPSNKEKGPLPLDKIFADDAKDEDNNSLFVSDNDDFGQDMPSSLLSKFNMSLTAAKLTATPQILFQRDRSRTVTTNPSDDEGIDESAIVGDNSRLTNSVCIKNLIHMWPCRPDLAAEYRMDIYSHPLSTAEHNAEVAKRHGISGDEFIWRLLCAYIKVEIKECLHPYGSLIAESRKFDWEGGRSGLRVLLPKIVDHLEAEGNIQLLVCISTVIAALRSYRNAIRTSTDPYVTAKKLGLTIVEPYKKRVYQLNRDSSVSLTSIQHCEHITHYHDSKFDTALTESHLSYISQEVNSVENHSGPLVDKSTLSYNTLKKHPDHLGKQVVGPQFSVEICSSHLFDFDCPPQPSSLFVRPEPTEDIFGQWILRLVRYRLHYAKLLTIWGLDLHRVEILKYSGSDSLIKQKISEFQLRDPGHAVVDIKMSTSICIFCHEPIYKQFEYCMACSHAMHSHCAFEWWQTEQDCPQGCGCQCKRKVSILPKVAKI